MIRAEVHNSHLIKTLELNFCKDVNSTSGVAPFVVVGVHPIVIISQNSMVASADHLEPAASQSHQESAFIAGVYPRFDYSPSVIHTVFHWDPASQWINA